MNPYELILVIDPALGEEKLSVLVGKIEEKIKGLKGEIEKIEKWGNKRLSSMIKKAKRLTQGYYVFFSFKSLPSAPAEIRGFLKVNESVISYMLTRAEVFAAPNSEEKEISGTPLAAVNVGEIPAAPEEKGLGQS